MTPGNLRIASPAALAVAAVLFFLPWINVSCQSPAGEKLVISQTGLQAAFGQTTVALEKDGGTVVLDDEARRQRQAGDGPFGGGFAGNDGGPDPAFLVLLFLPAALGGAVAGFVVKEHAARAKVVGLCAAAAAGLLLLQVVVGFPIADVPDEMPIQLNVSYTPWFWLVLLLAAGAAAAACFELQRRQPAADWQRPGEFDSPDETIQ